MKIKSKTRNSAKQKEQERSFFFSEIPEDELSSEVIFGRILIKHERKTINKKNSNYF